MQYRQIHELAVERGKVGKQMIDQCLADTEQTGLRIDRKAPQAAAAARVAECFGMIDADRGTDDIAGTVVLRHDVGNRGRIALRPYRLGIDRHHAARAVQTIHGSDIGSRRQFPHRHTGNRLLAR